MKGGSGVEGRGEDAGGYGVGGEGGSGTLEVCGSCVRNRGEGREGRQTKGVGARVRASERGLGS